MENAYVYLFYYLLSLGHIPFINIIVCHRVMCHFHQFSIVRPVRRFQYHSDPPGLDRPARLDPCGAGDMTGFSPNRFTMVYLYGVLTLLKGLHAWAMILVLSTGLCFSAEVLFTTHPSYVQNRKTA